MNLLNPFIKYTRSDPQITSGYKNIFIYQSELEYISRCILDYPDIETGGNLFGSYTRNGIPVVEYVIGPGLDAVHRATRFNQGERYLREVYQRISRKFALSEIGAWHSHHQLDLPHPSGGDVRTVMNGLNRNRLDEFIIVIGSLTPPVTPVNPFVFINNPHQPYRAVEWTILDGASPFREKVEELCKDILIHPSTPKGAYGSRNNDLLGERHWLSDKKNVEQLRAVVDYCKERTETVKATRPEGAVVIDVGLKDRKIKVVIPDSFPDPPSYTIMTDREQAEQCSVLPYQSISESLINNLKDKLI